VRAIRHAETDDLVGPNVAALVRSPTGRQGRPSKALTVDQARSSSTPQQAGFAAKVRLAVRTTDPTGCTGRTGIVADLLGPASGAVTLPLRLYWSPAGRVFDLDDAFMLQSMYQVVLGEAIRAEELTGDLNRDRLIAVWRTSTSPKECGG
jgi:hypothetical protein